MEWRSPWSDMKVSFGRRQGYRITPCHSGDFFVTPRRPNHTLLIFEMAWALIFLPTVSWQATELFYGAIKIRQSAVDGMTRRTLVKVCQWSVTIRFDAKNLRSIEKIHQISYWSVSSKPFYYIPINLVLNYNFLWYTLSSGGLVNSSNLIILLV